MFGFLEIESTKQPKIRPIPIPAPVNPEVANPAPIFCDDDNNTL